MKTSGVKMNYRFDAKRTWRQQMWNDITRRLERMSIGPHNAIVLYLGGESDLDRRILLQRGYREHNLLLVERDAGVCNSLREQGKIVFHGDFWKILNSLTYVNNLTPHVVFADLCGIVSDEVAIEAIDTMSQVSPQVRALNVLRGRDAKSIAFSMSDGLGMHRLERLWRRRTLVLNELTRRADASGTIPPDDNPSADDYINAFFMERCNPTFRTYKSSSGQVFDSVVYSTVRYALPQNHPWMLRLLELDETVSRLFRDENQDVIRSAAAVLANRTRKMSQLGL